MPSWRLSGAQGRSGARLRALAKRCQALTANSACITTLCAFDARLQISGGLRKAPADEGVSVSCRSGDVERFHHFDRNRPAISQPDKNLMTQRRSPAVSRSGRLPGARTGLQRIRRGWDAILAQCAPNQRSDRGASPRVAGGGSRVCAAEDQLTDVAADWANVPA